MLACPMKFYFKGYTLIHTTILQLCGICPGQPGWAGTRRNIHPLHKCFYHYTLINLTNYSETGKGTPDHTGKQSHEEHTVPAKIVSK